MASSGYSAWLDKLKTGQDEDSAAQQPVSGCHDGERNSAAQPVTAAEKSVALFWRGVERAQAGEHDAGVKCIEYAVKGCPELKAPPSQWPQWARDATARLKPEHYVRLEMAISPAPAAPAAPAATTEASAEASADGGAGTEWVQLGMLLMGLVAVAVVSLRLVKSTSR